MIPVRHTFLLFIGFFLITLGNFGVKAQEESPGAVDFFMAQYPDLDSFIVKKIEIIGNERTKSFIIHRELSIEKGDTLSLKTLKKVLKTNEQQVNNTRLFREVTIEPFWLNKGNAKLLIRLDERWYTFPRPVFALADRNFNEWWVERDHEWSRTVYGVIFYQQNLRGRDDQLQLGAQFGFRENYSLFYTLPFLSKNSEIGLEVGASYDRTKKLPYAIEDNNLVYHFGSSYLRKDLMGELKFTRRKGIHVTHELQSNFNYRWVGATITSKNKAYFDKGNNVQRFFRLAYTYERDYRDRVNYAKSGYYLGLTIEKLGLGIFKEVNHTRSYLTFQKFWPLGGNFSMGSEIQGLYSLPGFQSFSLEKGLGYRDVLVRGYEYDVIDGQNYVLNRNDLRYQLWDSEIGLEGVIPFQKFNTVPISIYLKAFVDQGYVVDNYEKPENSLANQYLSGWGLGMDIVTYYDMVFRLEYAFNNRGERDLFLHFVKPF